MTAGGEWDAREAEIRAYQDQGNTWPCGRCVRLIEIIDAMPRETLMKAAKRAGRCAKSLRVPSFYTGMAETLREWAEETHD